VSGLINKYKLARSVGRGQKTKSFIEGILGVAVAFLSSLDCAASDRLCEC
jgi:hypothetical protein